MASGRRKGVVMGKCKGHEEIIVPWIFTLELSIHMCLTHFFSKYVLFHTILRKVRYLWGCSVGGWGMRPPCGSRAVLFCGNFRDGGNVGGNVLHLCCPKPVPTKPMKCVKSDCGTVF